MTIREVDFKKESKPIFTAQVVKEIPSSLTYLAKANMSYYKDLRKEGFSEEQALELVKSFKWGG